MVEVTFTSGLLISAIIGLSIITAILAFWPQKELLEGNIK